MYRNIDETSYIKLAEIRKLLGIKVTATTFEKEISEYKLEMLDGILCFSYSGNRDAIIGDIVNRLQSHFYLEKIVDQYERVDYIFENMSLIYKIKYPLLLSTYKEFIYAKLNTSQSTPKVKKSMVTAQLNGLNCLFQILNKDIDSITQFHINKLFDVPNVSMTYLLWVGYYLDYMKNRNLVDSNINLKIRGNKRIKTDDDFYSKQEWANYVNFAFDIDKHIIPAMNNVVYARCFLYLLLNLCITWRKNDIVSIPSLENLIDIEEFTLDWFYNNTFEISHANYVIENTKLFLEQYSANKNSEYLHFDIAMAFRIPLSIAIIIVEQWRRTINDTKLFGTKRIDMELMVQYLGLDAQGFNNTKANRTLLSMVDTMASDLEMDSYVKYSSYMRAHKTSYYNLTDTTSQYLHATYSEKELNDLTLQLYSRGPFGWLYETLLDIENQDNICTFQEKTNLIVSLQETLSANEIENISSLLLQQDFTKERVINEILLCDKDERKDFIKKVHSGAAYSKQESFMCIKGNNCPYPLKDKCIGCEYSIPTMYSMLCINDELEKLLNKNISQCKRDNLRDLDKLLKLFQVIKDAKDSFSDDFVNSFFSFDSIKIQLTNKYQLLTKEIKESEPCE